MFAGLQRTGYRWSQTPSHDALSGPRFSASRQAFPYHSENFKPTAGNSLPSGHFRVMLPLIETSPAATCNQGLPRRRNPRQRLDRRLPTAATTTPTSTRSNRSRHTWLIRALAAPPHWPNRQQAQPNPPSVTTACTESQSPASGARRRAPALSHSHLKGARHPDPGHTCSTRRPGLSQTAVHLQPRLQAPDILGHTRRA